MNLRRHCTQLLSSAFTLMLLAGTTPTYAAELNLSNVPLFLDSGVDPNILLLIDDSGSMDSLVMLSEAARTAHSNDDEQVVDYANNSRWDVIEWSPKGSLDVRRLCTGYNALAYNPEINYAPWTGVDEDGNDYVNRTPDNALTNPFKGTTKDVSGNVYFTWDDKNTNGQYDSGDCPNLPKQIVDEEYYTCPKNWELYGDDQCRWRKNRNSSWEYQPATLKTREKDLGFTDQACRDEPQCQLVKDLTSAQQQNYANWYSYYRKRDYVMKKAALALVSNSAARMGLGVLNSNAGLAIQDMDDGNDSTDADSTAKTALMQQISKIKPSGGTPLRQALYNAGEYYRDGSGAVMNLTRPGSPILSDTRGVCQQNFTILMTDGYANGTFNNSVGNRDKGTDGTTTIGNWRDPVTVRIDENNSDYDGGYYADNVSNTLADIAMKYYEDDLAPNLADGVPNSNGGTKKMHQHMITYAVAFGVNGKMSCNPGEAIDAAGTLCPDEWPTEIKDESPESIDDLRHAAFNGRGQYLNAANPQALIQQMQAAMNSIEARTSSSAAVAANSTTLSQGTVVYQALFNTGDWRGDLQAMPISIGPTDTRDACRDIAKGKTCVSADWHASAELNKLNFDTDRTILTYNPNSSETSKGIPFRWPADYNNPGDHDLGTAQTAHLLGNASSGQEASYGQALVDYLRGDNSNEGVGFNFRTRATALGDIINSAPTFVGPPRFNYPDNMESSPYSAYVANFAGRTKIIYVGGNDGMLHGFNATTGVEEIAYVPSMMLHKMEMLSGHDYTNQGNHRFFVDGSPTVGDAYFGGSWRTILVGGLNSGGQGIYALDVTDPTKFTEEQDDINDVVLWEFTDTDLGYTYSQPDIVKMNNGKWAAIFGNGYNNTEADGDASTTGFAYLYVVDLETGALIKKISTGVGSVGTPNGLATATPTDVNGDGKADYLYAGDLEGNLWRFNVTSADPNSWNATNIFTAVAPDAGNPRQPITSRPSVSFHPNAQKDGFMVFFGTGRYIDVADSVASGQNTQTFYGIWDELSSTPPTFHGDRTADENDSTADYLKQKITSEPVISATGAVLRITTDKPIDWSKHHGWYIDLVNTETGDNRGERQITNSLVRGDRVVFTTMMPNDIACDFGGNSFLMELSVENGGPLEDPPLDINNDGVIDENDLYNGQVPSGTMLDGIVSDPTVLGGEPTETKVLSSSTGEIKSVEERPPVGLQGKRKSWAEVMQ